MDTLESYRHIIQQVLTPYLNISYANADLQNRAIFDREHDNYGIISVGWQGDKRIHCCLLHLEIINGKVWIQYDGTEDGIAYELETAGIPKMAMVLGFHEPKVRQYTGYAVA